MAIYRVNPSPNQSLKSLKSLIPYIWDAEKSSNDLFFCRNLQKNHAYEDMLFIKNLYGKTDGKQYLHAILSFSKEITAQISHELLKELVPELLSIWDRNYQIIAAPHFNTEHLHIHLAWNSVDFTNGRKYTSSPQDLKKQKQKINAVLEKYGLPPIRKLQVDCDGNHNNIAFDDDWEYPIDAYEDDLTVPFTIEPFWFEPEDELEENEMGEYPIFPFLIEPFWFEKR